MNTHIEERPDDGGIAFYLDGDLQFDSADEALYHEGLALPALSLARAADPALGLRVLICGGGDGLALRECLRFPGVASVDLVDYSAEVVDLGRTAFRALNESAFEDPRAQVTLADAWEFLAAAPESSYDAVLCDFTVPRRPEDARVFTREWFDRVARVLAPEGIAGLNGFSPQRCPEAFACLQRTVAAAGLQTLPFRVCIPSFRDQGYGAWGFLLAGHCPLRRADLKGLASACPVRTRALDMSRVWHAAGFPSPESCRTDVPVHSLEHPCLLTLLLNPGGGDVPTVTDPPALDTLFQSVPILHPYHTRVMIESLAEQVVGSVRALDLRRLLDALLAHGRELAEDLRRELETLRAFLDRSPLPRVETWGDWARRVFVALVLLLTLANIVAPDNVFGKGSEGIGHSSISRGYSSGGGSFGRSLGGSFGRGASGFRSGVRGGGDRAAGSFGRQGWFGSSSFHADTSRPDAPLSGGGFRGGWQRGEPADIFGNSYRPRTFRYRPIRTDDDFYYFRTYGMGGHGVSTGTPPQPVEQPARFVADDDMLVLDNGEVVITLSDAAYLLISGGRITLMSNSSADPVMPLFPDPRVFANITARLAAQKSAAEHEIGLRRDWLSWVGWTDFLFPVVRADENEVKGLEDLVRRLDAAARSIPTPTPDAKLPPDLPDALAKDATELFAGGGLLADGRVALVDDRGVYWFTDGKTMTSADTAGSAAGARPCPPPLREILLSILPKLERETAADEKSLESDLSSLQQDKASLQKDMTDYTALQSANGPDYEVDYGTDSIPARQALERTQRDLAQNATDTQATLTEQAQTRAQHQRLLDAVSRFGR